MSENTRLKEWQNKYNSSVYGSNSVHKIKNTVYSVSTGQSMEYVGFWRRFFAFILGCV